VFLSKKKYEEIINKISDIDNKISNRLPLIETKSNYSSIVTPESIKDLPDEKKKLLML
jgi:hypothetical protein